jgi:hypothetical protein
MDNRTLARVAVLASIPAIALEPLTASAYFRTKDGKSSGDPSWIAAWSEPLQRHLHGLFSWGSADTVYLTYGKGFALAFAGMLAAVVLMRRAAPTAGTGRFGWAPKASLVAYSLALAGVFGEYWTPWTDQAFVGLSLPGILLLFTVSPFLGAWMLRNRIGSRVGAWMVALTMLGIIGTTALGGHLGFAVIYLSVAWMLNVRALMHPVDRALGAELATART